MRITHDKILSSDEVDDLVIFLRERSRQASGDALASMELDRLIITALLSSGLRNSEICCLMIGDTIMHLGVSVFVVRQPLSHKRTVYLPRHLSILVKRYAQTVRPLFLPEGVDPADPTQPLLMNERRRPFDRTSLYRRVVRILTEAGLGDRANVQLLRHTYGYIAYLRTGGNLLFVQRQLGHAHPATTSIYAELVNESYADLAERVLPDERPAVGLERKACVKRMPRFDCEID